MKKSIFRIVSIIVLLLLLIKSNMAYEGAKNGLILWSQVVVPTLLPFMICSNVIVSLDAIHLLTFPFQFLLKSMMKLSKAGSYVLVSGILCGFPMGAKTCSEFLTSEKITKKEGQYLLSICNHPSPMFLLGYVAVRLPEQISLLSFLLAVYLPTLLIAWLARTIYGIKDISPSLSPGEKEKISFDESLMNSFDVMIKIGGYMMIFSILAMYVNSLPIGSTITKAMTLGLIEFTTGIQSLSQAGHTTVIGLCIIFSATFGGLSGIFQAKSVLMHKDLSILHYFAWKILHSIFAVAVMVIILVLKQLTGLSC